MSNDVDRETRRMEILGIVKIASDAIAKYWPLRTFVHHNPLVGLESVPFGHAVRLGQRRLGGRGYLSCEAYRSYLAAGRIQPAHLDSAVATIADDSHVELGARRVSRREVLRACLVHGIGCPGGNEAVVDDEELDKISSHLAGVLDLRPLADRHVEDVHGEQAALADHLTLSQWCDHALGTGIVQQVNDELIKWCAAFLDEGHATWPMPGRERGFYPAWKALAAREWSPCGISDSKRKIAGLPDHADECLRDSLSTMGVPFHRWADYLSLQLAALPGWAGFIRWRAEQTEYPWQTAYPISLVQYLAVRLWYERELVSQHCRDKLGIAGTVDAISAYMRDRGRECVSDKARATGRPWPEQADVAARDFRREAARLRALARALDIAPATLHQATPRVLATLLDWLDAFSEPHHGAVWLEAFEATYREELLTKLARGAPGRQAQLEDPVRPQSQSIYCIDVRMEPFRRHLEALAYHETFACAGFFAAPIRFRPWGSDCETDQCPAITKPRNQVREIPRSYRDHVVAKHLSRAGLLHAGRTLTQELKENVVTPFVMVESLGWFYGIPLVGKTMWPRSFARLKSWLSKLLFPHVATSLTVDKLSPAEIDEMLVAEQRAIVWKTVSARGNAHPSRITPSLVEAVRRQAIAGDESLNAVLISQGQELGLTPEVLASIVDELRERWLNERSVSHQKERLSRAGFTLDEQVKTVEALLRMIGLLSNFARLILICAHGSSSTNNPYEAALDCGACGGNAGKPNARLVAMMANNPEVRQRLRLRGIAIPPDTHFVAGQLDTTTDRVELFDLEDVPATHRRDVARLKEDLREAGMLTSQERYARLPDGHAGVPLARVWDRVQVRSADWSQVRPEWGLSGNAAFIVGPRRLSKGLDLSGRVFMHSYDWRLDPSGIWLEVILTGPQLVCEWISLEHYFSTVDNDIYGSGSKVYHNVVGRLGVMSGPRSDLRVGLAQQTVMNGGVPFHEPMRLLTVIDAPRARLDALIARHRLLQHYYHNEWVRLVIIEDGVFYRFSPTNGWIPVSVAPSASCDLVEAAASEAKELVV